MSTLFLTRLVIETTSPMAIYSGERETSFDNQLVRDASGLPYLPATSIAGVWRKLVRENCGEICAQSWFGKIVADEGHSSNITLSDGVLLNSKNEPVKPLMLKKSIEQDPLLSLLHQAKPLHRERVKINDRGDAYGGAKFDQVLLPTGVRFTLTIKVNEASLNESMKKQWQSLLSLWVNEAFSLGATTRNGLGKFKVVGCLQKSINLADGISSSTVLKDFYIDPIMPTTSDLTSMYGSNVYAVLPVKGIDNWRCGAGTELLGKTATENTVSMITYSESPITWSNEKANINSKAVPIMCGSSIKGIFAHRIAYHWRKHNKIWAETMAECSHEEWQTRPEALKDIFGFADDDNHDESIAGKIFVDDAQVYFEPKNTVVRTHNSIDRFTGGVRKGALFSEELLYQPEFSITLRLAKDIELTPTLKSALDDTINDLKIGLLPMGAGSGRGTSLVMQNTAENWVVHDDNILTTEEDINQESATERNDKEIAHEH